MFLQLHIQFLLSIKQQKGIQLPEKVQLNHSIHSQLLSKLILLHYWLIATSGGFSFESINYSASTSSENETEIQNKAKEEEQRTYVVGSHGKKLLIPRKEDIMVVERPLDPK